MLATFNAICAPARLYFVISIIAMVVMLFTNVGGENVYCLGDYKCDVPSITMVFLIKLIYVIFWTWVLSLICKSGNPMISWLLVLFPFILFFILILMMVMSMPAK
jgi:hypothetical protein